MLAVVIEAQSLLVFLRDRLMVSFVYQFYIENKVVFQGGWVGGNILFSTRGINMCYDCSVPFILCS